MTSVHYSIQSTECVHAAEPAGCAQGFMDSAVLRHVMASTSVAAYPGAVQPIRQLNFFCPATVKKWIVGAKINGEGTVPPKIRLYSGTRDSSVNFTLTSLNATPYLNVYEYEPSPPVQVQQDDYIGLEYQADSSSQIYYQRYGLGNSADLPLISVVLGGRQLHCSCSFNSCTYPTLCESQAAYA